MTIKKKGKQKNIRSSTEHVESGVRKFCKFEFGNIVRRTTHDDGQMQRPIAKGHLSVSDDLKTKTTDSESFAMFTLTM